jgi:ATP-dependent Lhr-like helicase
VGAPPAHAPPVPAAPPPPASISGGSRPPAAAPLLPSAVEPDPRAPRARPPLEDLAAQLLRRWGVVFRDLLAREPGAPPWRELLPIYRAGEARGELRGGRFVAGLSGEQFALPAAVEALRAVRRAPREGERVELSAADPLNLVGILLPGPRVPATLGARIALVDGVPAAVDAAPSSRAGGRRVRPGA